MRMISNSILGWSWPRTCADCCNSKSGRATWAFLLGSDQHLGQQQPYPNASDQLTTAVVSTSCFSLDRVPLPLPQGLRKIAECPDCSSNFSLHWPQLNTKTDFSWENILRDVGGVTPHYWQHPWRSKQFKLHFRSNKCLRPLTTI